MEKKNIVSIICLTLLVMLIVTNQGAKYKMQSDWKVFQKNTSISSTGHFIEVTYKLSEPFNLPDSILKGVLYNEKGTRIIATAKAKIDDNQEYHLVYKLKNNDLKKLKDNKSYIKTTLEMHSNIEKN